MDDTHAELVLDWYCDLEGRFVQLLGTIPFTEKTQDTFLPSISSIVLEAASLLDTVFRTEYSGSGTSNDLNIVTFAKHFEPVYGLARRHSVLLRHPVQYITPFDGWIDAAGEYKALSWWNAYNKLKHDRITHYELSTLNTALLSVCALHQMIALFPCFVTALFRRNLIVCGSWNPILVADIMRSKSSNDDLSVCAAFETELFCSSTIAGDFPRDLMRLNVYRYGPSRLFRNLAYLSRTPNVAT